MLNWRFECKLFIQSLCLSVCLSIGWLVVLLKVCVLGNRKGNEVEEHC